MRPRRAQEPPPPRLDPGQLRRKPRILVDTSPDLREQLLDAEVSDVEAVIWTHDHADHCHGIDDLRQLYHARGRPVAGYARERRRSICCERRFAYAFEGKGGYPAVVAAHLLPNHVNLAGLSVRAVDQPHGDITSAGLRFDAGGVAIGYSTDFDSLTDDMAMLFEGLDLWVVDALRRKPHPDPSASRPDARMDSPAGAEARYPDPYGQQHGLSHALRRAPGRGRAGL